MRRIHISFLVAVSMIGIAAGAPSTASALTIAYWRFENNLNDSSGNGLNASATGTSFSTNIFGTPVRRNGLPNTRSLELANTPGNTQAVDYLSVSHHPLLSIATGSFTIEAWVRLDEFDAASTRRYYLVQKKNIGDTDDLASYTFLARAGNLGGNPQGLVLQMGDGAAAGGSLQTIFSNLLIDDSAWHHVSVALDGTTGDVRFTLDGQTDFQAGAVDMNQVRENSDTLYIGAHASPGAPTVNHGFDGGVDELRISDTFLAESQLLAVPEPATVTLAACGGILLLVLILFRTQRRRTCRS